MVVMIIFLGPDQIVELAAKLGRAIRKITHSEIWMSIWQTSREIRNIPKTLADETGLEESINDIKGTANELKKDLGEAQNEIKGAQVIQPVQPLEEVNSATAALKQAGYIASIPKEEVSPELTDEPTDEPIPPKPQEVPTLLKKKDK
jgi:Sec-independent protein translocase protein TatA